MKITLVVSAVNTVKHGDFRIHTKALFLQIAVVKQTAITRIHAGPTGFIPFCALNVEKGISIKMSIIREKIVTFLSRYLSIEKLEDDTNFIQAGLVNSLFAMQLVLYLEGEFSIEVKVDDMNLDNFGTINAIVQFVKSKTNA